MVIGVWRNRLHWCLDVSFPRRRKPNGIGARGGEFGDAASSGVVVAKADGTKGSIRTRRMRAGWDDDYLLQVLHTLLSTDK